MTSDLRFAVRSLRQSPGFGAVAVLALGVGLGLSTTMFAVLDAVVNPYTAYRRPDQLHYVRWWLTRPMTAADLYRFLRQETRTFQAVLPVGSGMARIEAGGEEVEVQSLRVPVRYFDVMGVRPDRGRAFTESDGEDAVMLGQNLWRRLFGTRRSLDGLSVMINGQPRIVVGVLPRGETDGGVLVPLASALEREELPAGVQSLVRLQEGVTREQANAALKTLAQRLTDRLNVPDRPIGLDLSPLVWRNETIRDIHKAMLGAALAVLLIACVNLAHLMLARGLSKRRELALRMALGATRAAVVRHMFAECLLITAAGLLVGGLVTVWCDDILSNRMPRSIAWILVQPRMSWRVFGVAGCTVAASAILFGLVPAIRVALDLNLDEPLKDNAGTTTGRVRQRYSTLVVAEVALALVLMMGGGLMLRTVMKLQRERFNFDPRKLYRANVTPPRGGPGQTTLARRHEVLGAARAVEGVQDAAIITRKVAPGGMVSAELADDSNRTIVLNEYGMGMYPLVSPEYFRVLGLPVLQGRDFEPGDAAGSGVAIIDGLAAQRLYPNQDPVGRMLKLGSPSSAHAPWVPIVGVVRSPYVLRVEGRFAPPPSLFVARAESLGYGELVMRTTTPDPSVATRVMRRLMSLPGVRQVSVGPYDYARQRELEQTGFLAKVFVTLGSVALGLAVLGLYGVLSYAVTRRMREFAVRLALGAEPRGLLRMVLHDGTVMVLGGIGLGAFIALASTRWLDAVLVSVLPSDVVSLLLAEAVLLSVGLAAALGPARRAARANPLDILRAT